MQKFVSYNMSPTGIDVEQVVCVCLSRYWYSGAVCVVVADWRAELGDNVNQSAVAALN